MDIVGVINYRLIEKTNEYQVFIVIPLMYVSVYARRIITNWCYVQCTWSELTSILLNS